MTAPTRRTRGRGRNFVKVGTVKIPWYKVDGGRRTQIDPRKYGRKIVTKADHEEALLEARRIAVEINQGGVEVLALTPHDRAVYAQACSAAQACGTDLPHLVTEYRAAHEILSTAPGHSMAEVLRAGIAALARPVHKLADVIAAFLMSRATEDYDGRHEKDHKNVLRDFGVAFAGDISLISAEQIETWLNARTRPDGKPLSPKRRNHIHAIVVSLFKFARERKMLPDVITAAQSVKKRKVHGGEIDFFTPEEMITVLKHVEEDWLPWPLLVGFGAMRVEEVALGKHAASRKDCLRWEDFDWLEREIVVRKAVAKKSVARRIPIQDNLWHWLTPWRDRHARGPVVPGGDTRGQLDNYRARLQTELRRKVGELEEITPRIINWPQNALRHSYGSYRMAVTKNAHQVSNEMGDSPAMITRHYDNPRPKTQAAAYWAIYPADALRTSQLILKFSPAEVATG